MSRHKYKLYLGWVLASVCGTFWSGVSAQNVSSSDYPDCTGYAAYIQDGHCDEINNVADCGWDGGDCCFCTCLDDLEHDCGVLADYDCVDPDADCAAAVGYPDCTGPMYNLEDGNCDEDLNNEECGYDGGDCCRCTCTDPYGWECDRGSFDCKDPEAPDDCETASPTPSPAASYGYPDCTGVMYYHQNGYCSDDLNNEECGYDGGDCCRCTCRTLSTWYSSRCSDYFDCKDPEAPLDCPTPSPAAAFGYPDCTGYMYNLKDGKCDEDLNNEDCGYDGGDCCRCTCTGPYGLECDGGNFDCKDPEAPDDCDTASPTPSPAASYGYPDCTGNMYYYNSGYCLDSLNNEECGYDGGDCCRCTCTDPYGGECDDGNFDCKDPEAPDDCETASPTPSPAASYGYPDCTGVMYYYQNGYCSDDLNNEECGYDGGDCCRCTCGTLSTYDSGTRCSGSFDCKDPEAPLDCPTPSPTLSPAASLGYPDCEGYLYDFQNGNCDSDLNNAECGFDGGDCCSCTCQASSSYTCGPYYNCLDPDADCVDSTLTETTDDDASFCAETSRRGNGYCSYDLNTEACDYDGGDCCECTCSDTGTYDCGYNGYDCLDPNACSSPSSSRSASGAASSSDPSTSFLTQPLSTALIVVLVLFGAGMCFIGLQFTNFCRKNDALHTGSRLPPPPVISEAPQPGGPHGDEALSYNPRRVSAPAPAPGHGTPAWYRRLWPEGSSRQINTGASPSPPQRASARSAPPQPSAPPVLPQPSAPQMPLSAASRPIVPTRSVDSRQQRAPRTAVFGPAPDGMVGGQPGIHDASESDRNVMVTSYQESRRLAALDENERVQMAIKESLKLERNAEAMSQHANDISGGETKSDEAAEPTDEPVADRSGDGGSEWGGDDDRNVVGESSPRSVPLVAESGGGCGTGKESTRTAEAGNDSEEAEEETQASPTTRKVDGLSVKRGKHVEASSEEAKGAQNDDTASEPTDTVGKLATLEQGGGAPADLEEEIVQEGVSSGDRNGESSGAETGGSDHGASCEQSLEGDSETTREDAFEHKTADVSDEVVKYEADSAPLGVGSEGTVTGH